MTRVEYRLLGRLASQVKARNEAIWHRLKYETQFGPESWDFPYYPAALELSATTIEIVYSLSQEEKEVLLHEWQTQTWRDISGPTEAILDRFGVMVLDLIINRARAAGRRAY